MDIEQFYAEDERRRRSAEIEFGTEWFDGKGNRYELSWVQDTGELYAMLEMTPEADSWTPFGDIEVEKLSADRVVVTVVADIAGREEVEAVLDGWQAEMGKPDGISWVADRLREHGVAARSPS
jgi:hypothetical protein